MTTITTRYIFIESNSGFIWGEASASGPVIACQMMEADVVGESREYELLEHDPRTTASYFIAYDATGTDIPLVEDGQDQEAINAVSALPVAGYVRSTVIDN